MADKVRIGMIGVGQIGKHHLENYAKVPEAEIVAACDIAEDEAKRVAQQYNIPHVYTDYHEMLKREDIQSVDVCLHNRFHMPVTVDALRAGKNVYCEKPMSWTYRDAKTMYDTAKATGQMLHIQLAGLYRNTTVCAKRIIDEGLLGEIYGCKSIHYRRRGRPWVDGYGSPAFVNTGTSGGGAMLDMAVYHISQMLYLLGNPKPLSVSGKTYQKLDNMYEDRRASGKYNVEELGMGLARLEGGITFALEEAWAINANDPNEDRVYGSHAGLRLEPFTYYATLADMEMDGAFDVDQAIWRWNQCDPKMRHYANSQRHWVSAQLGLVPLLDTAGIALNTAFITEGVYISSHLGREVTADEIAQAEPGFGRV
ncbi:MAG: Gfo/Idh/MocA family oxidoreductase [Chloroflexi bacterium]|nr:Gfo/Idh/MocA family oxidoreductase [Chloroflexota bacterium]